MTLLSIAKSVGDEIKTGVPIEFVVNNNDPDVRLILRLAQKVGIALMQRVDWQELRGEVEFTSLAQEEQTGILPIDFDHFVDETFWDRSLGYLVIGPVTAVTWQGLKANTENLTERSPRFILRQNEILIQPVPGAGNNLAFEYISKNWCQSAQGVGQPQWLADDDVGVIDEELMTLGIIFNYYLSEGLPQTAAASEQFMDKLTTLMRNNESDTRIMAAADIFEGPRHTTGEPQDITHWLGRW